MKAAPDTYVQIFHQEIELLVSGEATIYVEYGMQGTKVMDIKGFPEAGEDKVVLTSSVNLDYDLADNFGKKLQVNATINEFRIDPITGLAMEWVAGVERFGVGVVSEYPTIIDVPMARTTFYINPDKKIYKIVAVK